MSMLFVLVSLPSMHVTSVRSATGAVFLAPH